MGVIKPMVTHTAGNVKKYLNFARGIILRKKVIIWKNEHNLGKKTYSNIMLLLLAQSIMVRHLFQNYDTIYFSIRAFFYHVCLPSFLLCGVFSHVCDYFLLMRPFHANICLTNTHLYAHNTSQIYALQTIMFIWDHSRSSYKRHGGSVAQWLGRLP